MFGCRFPFVCISIGLTIGKVPTVGVVYNPIMDEVRFYKSHVSFRWPDITWNFKWLKFYVEHAEFTSFHIAWWSSTCMLDVSASYQGNWWIQIIANSSIAVTMRNARFCALHNYRIGLLFLQILLLILIVNIFPLHTFESLKLSSQGCIKITRNEWKLCELYYNNIAA